MKKLLISACVLSAMGAAYSAPPKVIFSSIAAPDDAGTNSIPQNAGLFFTAPPTATTANRILDSIQFSPDFTRWVGIGRIENGTTDIDSVIYGTGVDASSFKTTLIENQPYPLNTAVNVDGITAQGVDIDDNGNLLVSGDDTGTATLDDFLLEFDGTTFTELHRQGGQVPDLDAGNLFQGAFQVCRWWADRLYFGNTAGTTSGAARATFWKDFSVLTRATVTVPTNQAAAGTSTMTTMTQGSFEAAHFPPKTIYVGTLTTPASTTILCVDNDVKVQRGQPLGSLPSTVTLIDTDPYMAPGGNWIARGNQADGTDWVLLNNEVVAVKGGPIAPTTTALWSDNTFANGFFTSMVNNLGETIIGGLTDEVDVNANAFIQFSSPGVPNKVLIKEGDAVDVTGDGAPDDAFIATFNDDNGFLTDNLYWYFSGNLRNGAGTIIGNAFMRLEIPIPGDIDGDGEIGPGDFETIVSDFGLEVTDPNADPNADIDGDGEIGPGDFEYIVLNFGRAR